MEQSPISVTITEGGRIVIPARLRKALGVKEGDSLVAELRDGCITLTTRAAGVRRARELLAGYLGPPSLANELLAERRAEADD